MRILFASPKYSKKFWLNESYSWRRSWAERRAGSDTNIYYGFDQYDPTKGWISKPNIRDMSVFDGNFLNTNSKGYRGIVDYPAAKDSNKPRVLILGDSFTFGDEVSDNETYSHYLSQMIPTTEFINLGVHGYGHDQMLIALKEEQHFYQPDIVLLGFIELDMIRNTLGFRDYAKPRFVSNGRDLKLIGSPVPSPEQMLWWDPFRPRVIDLYSHLHHRWSQSKGLIGKRKKDITSAILNVMVDFVVEKGAVPIIAYLPQGHEIESPSSLVEGEKFLFSFCESNSKVKCFSARPQFRRQIEQGAQFRANGHWKPLGHNVVATAIANYLKENNFFNIRSAE